MTDTRTKGILLSAGQICADFDDKYKGVFGRIEDARLAAVKDGHSWPGWCYCPISASLAVMKTVYGLNSPSPLVMESAKAAGLAAWRMGGKNVLLFHPDTLGELWKTEIKGDIPVSTLLRFPFWGAYIPLDETATGQSEIRGTFVHLEYDNANRRAEFRVLLHLATGKLMVIPLDLDANGTLDDAVKRTFNFSLEDVPAGERVEVKQYVDAVRLLVEPVMSVALYVCAGNAERSKVGRDGRIEDGESKPSEIPPKNDRSKKVFAPNDETRWAMGWRIGASIRISRESEERSGGGPSQGGTKAPHTRRAHWHKFFTGVRDDPSTHGFVQHWLPIITVNASLAQSREEWAKNHPVTGRRVVDAPKGGK